MREEEPPSGLLNINNTSDFFFRGGQESRGEVTLTLETTRENYKDGTPSTSSNSFHRNCQVPPQPPRRGIVHPDV